ncbi:class I SAM-dependent methyltransferase [Lutibacter sp.]
MNGAKKVYLTCKDYTVSGEEFNLVYNKKYTMLETLPKPSIKKIPSYYQSENYISHTDSNKSVVDKIYQIVKKYSLKKKLRLVNSFEFEEKKILDIGCGTGDFLFVCKNNGWNVVGVEPNEKARSISKSKLGAHTTNTLFTDIEELSNQTFDVITLWHVLEHVYNLESYIKLLKKHLKPSGTLIIAVPNFMSFDALYYKKYWAAFDVPRHLWHFSQHAIRLLFKNENMKVVDVKPMKFDSFYVSLLSEKYKSGTANFIRAFYIGLRSNLKAMKTKEYSSLIYVLKNS